MSFLLGVFWWFPVLSRSGIMEKTKQLKSFRLWFPVLSRSGIILKGFARYPFLLWFPVLSRSGIIVSDTTSKGVIVVVPCSFS